MSQLKIAIKLLFVCKPAFLKCVLCKVGLFFPTFSKPNKKECLKTFEKIMKPQILCLIVMLATALQTKFSLSRKYLRNLGSMPKMSAHALSTSRKHLKGSLKKIVG